MLNSYVYTYILNTNVKEGLDEHEITHELPIIIFFSLLNIK